MNKNSAIIYNILKNKMVYFLIFITLSFFITVNLFGYFSYHNNFFATNWLLYSFNQKFTSNFIIPVIFIAVNNFLISKLDSNRFMLIRLGSRSQIVNLKEKILMLNAVFFVLIALIATLLISISIGNFELNWNHQMIKSFIKSFDGVEPYTINPLIQIVISMVLLLLSLIFWGSINQVLVSIVKDRVTPTLITIFLIMLQGKMTSIPGFPRWLIDISPGNHLFIYSLDLEMNQSLYGGLIIDLVYWVILIGAIFYVFKLVYRHKQFN